MKVWDWAAVFMLVLAMFAAGWRWASASHLVYLPQVPATPLMQRVIQAQEYVWCADSRASAYPNFLSQLRDVNAQYAARVGIKNREVAYSDPSCQVKHVMPDAFPCGQGAAACIYYANWPVTVAYAYQLGYTDWRSAQGHELGHGLLGLHEQYQDQGGQLQCTGRQDTVMDCGSGIRYPQPLDVQRGCAVILTSWCGMAPVQTYPFYDGARWRFADGRSYDPALFNCGAWFDRLNRLEWGECAGDWRWLDVQGLWVNLKTDEVNDPATNITTPRP